MNTHTFSNINKLPVQSCFQFISYSCSYRHYFFNEFCLYDSQNRNHTILLLCKSIPLIDLCCDRYHRFDHGLRERIWLTQGLTLRILKHVDFWAHVRVAMFAVHAWRLAILWRFQHGAALWTEYIECNLAQGYCPYTQTHRQSVVCKRDFMN